MLEVVWGGVDSLGELQEAELDVFVHAEWEDWLGWWEMRLSKSSMFTKSGCSPIWDSQAWRFFHSKLRTRGRGELRGTRSSWAWGHSFQ